MFAECTGCLHGRRWPRVTVSDTEIIIIMADEKRLIDVSMQQSRQQQSLRDATADHSNSEMRPGWR